MRAPGRLAYVCADAGIPPDGAKGASVHFRELGRALVREGYDVQAVTRRPPTGAWNDFPLRAVGGGGRGVPDPLVRELAELTDQRGLAEALTECGPVQAVYERYSLWGLSGLRHARALGVPFFLEVNAPLWEEAERYRALALGAPARAVARELFRRASRVLVVSAPLRDRIIAEGAEPDRVIVFPNGVAPAFLEDTAPADVPTALRGRFILTFVGSLKPWHGIEMLLDAVLALPTSLNVGLWVVGDGPEAPRVDEAARLHPDRVVRTASVPHEQVPSVLRASDATVAPYTSSSPTYFCPLKVVEAFAAGVPLLASAVPAVQRLDLRGLTLGTFQPGSRNSFRCALERLLADPTAARASADHNRSVARGRFTWDQRARELGALLEDGAPLSTVGAA